jgi:hypothetical protein
MRKPHKNDAQRPSGALDRPTDGGRATAAVAVLIDSSTLALIGTAPSPPPSHGQPRFGDEAGAAGAWRAVSWPEDGADGPRFAFFAVCGFDSVIQLEARRTQILPGDGGAPVPFPALGRILLDAEAIVAPLGADAHRAADAFDLLNAVFAKPPFAASERTRAFATAVLRAGARQDGFVEILGRPECDGLLIQGWSFGLEAGMRTLLIQRDGLAPYEAAVGAFERNDLLETAHGFIGYFKDARGPAFACARSSA